MRVFAICLTEHDIQNIFLLITVGLSTYSPGVAQPRATKDLLPPHQPSHLENTKPKHLQNTSA